MSDLKAAQNNNTLLFFWMLALLALGVRAYVNFSQELLIGNGGYYPLQVRTILERGELAFSDMPLLFYLNAGIVQLIAWLGVPISDQLILNVVKCIDSLSIPLLLIPLYQLIKLTKNKEFSHHSIVIALYAVLSFYTLNLVSSSQKNALGITFLFFTIFGVLKYLLSSKSKKHLLFAFVFFILTGLTHFGTFVFTMIAGIIFILFQYKEKAFVPVVVLLILGLSIIYTFDAVRFERLISIGEGLLGSFPRGGQIIQAIFYGALALLALKGLQVFKTNFSTSERIVISTLIALLFIVPLPIINQQFTQRLATFLFIPQVLLLLFFSPLLSNKFRKVCSSLLLVVSLGSMVFIVFKTPRLSLSKEALMDLDRLTLSIADPENTVVVSRHNLEFWVAWTLNVDVSQESKFDSTLISDYEHVYILNQIKGLQKRREPSPSRGEAFKDHFREPIIPKGAVLVNSTECFRLYKYIKS